MFRLWIALIHILKFIKISKLQKSGIGVDYSIKALLVSCTSDVNTWSMSKKVLLHCWAKIVNVTFSVKGT